MEGLATESFKPGKENAIFNYAAKFILNGMDEDTDLVFLTGKAGTGKTTFLKYIADRMKNRVILAPTGIAAINAGGQTIHSFFHLSPNIIYTPGNPNLYTNQIYQHLALRNERVKVIEKMDLLIIDEVSMVRAEMLDAIDRILKVYRNSVKPFGGVRTLLIGDVFQLPPVIKDNEREIIYHYYETGYFFSSKAYMDSRAAFFEFDKVYRQDEQDFLSVLNNIRIGRLDLIDQSVLNGRVGTPDPDEHAICLYPNRRTADALNNLKFEAINHQVYVFEGIANNFNVEEMANVDKTIRLKVGTQVMTTVNTYAADGSFYYYNGSIGIVTAIDSQKSWIKVKLADGGREVVVERYTWKNVQQIYDEDKDEIVEKEVGSFTQIPVRLAWAITIHKSQGLTLDSVQVNVNRAFAHGQTYVAISRCRSLKGLHLEHEIGQGSVIVDQRVEGFYNSFREEFSRVMKNAEKAARLYEDAERAFKQQNGSLFVESVCDARAINNYITKILHAEFNKKVTVLAYKYTQAEKLAAKYTETELKNIELKEQLDKADADLRSAEEENTCILAKNEKLDAYISKLEGDLKEKLHLVEKKAKEIEDYRQKLKEMQQMFIEKTIELDRLKRDPWYRRLFKIGY